MEDGCNKDPVAGTFKLQWQEQGGTYADLGAATEIAYYDGSYGADGASTDSSLSSFTEVCGTHNEGEYSEDGNVGSVDLGLNVSTEHWFCVDTTNAQGAVIYEFQLYDTANGRTDGTLGGTLTTAQTGQEEVLTMIGAYGKMVVSDPQA